MCRALQMLVSSNDRQKVAVSGGTMAMYGECDTAVEILLLECN